MVLYHIQLKAELENIKSITFPKDYNWILETTDLNEGEMKIASFNSENSQMYQGGGPFCAIIFFNKVACKMIFKKTDDYNEKDSGSFKTILTVECRGLVPQKWRPESGCDVHFLSSDKVIPNVTLAEDWCGYDEAKDVPCSIIDIETRIIT